MSESFVSHFIYLLKYQSWMLDRTFAFLSKLSDKDYHADSGLVFRSIHAILCHLLATQRLWGGRLKGLPASEELFDLWEKMEDPYSKVPGRKSGWEAYVEDRAEAERELRAEAADILAYAESNLQSIMDSGNPITHRDSTGISASIPAQVLISHLVNHTTYHVGQVTVAIRNFKDAEGKFKYGDLDGLDMSYMPR